MPPDSDEEGRSMLPMDEKTILSYCTTFHKSVNNLDTYPILAHTFAMLVEMASVASSKKAFVIALELLVVLSGIFLYIWRTVDISRYSTSTTILFSALTVISLLTVIVYQSIKINISAKYLAENMMQDMLLYSKELFTQLYRGSPVPYILIQENGIIDSANYAAIRLFGTEEGWLPGKNIFDFIEGDDENHIALIPEYFKKDIFVNNEEVSVRRVDDTTRFALLSLFSFMDSQRKRKGLLTLVDITKQKEIDKAKTEFVSLASHQLRTPISAMKWNIELLRTTNFEQLSQLQQDYIDKIEHGLSRMDVLVGDFLNVSKFELGTLVPQEEQIKLGEFFEAVLEEQSKQAAFREITISREWEDEELVVHTDTHLLTMAIGNLVSNAIKYTPQQGMVRISAREEDGHLIIAVSDTGIGIPVDEQEHIFSKIFRASNARTHSPDGTGLGLYIVREAVKVLGGTISFVSKVGVGTTFTVVLPN